MDKDDLILAGGTTGQRGHGRKLRIGTCLEDVKQNSFPFNSVDTQNSLDIRVIPASSIQQIKESLGKYRYGDD